MREIEVKILDIDKAQVVAKLKELGAKQVFSGVLENKFYDFPGRLLSKQKIVLRLRRQTGKKTGILCVKTTISHFQIKQMNEHEVEIDFKKTHRLLENLGLECIDSVIKHRDQWVLGKIHFDFDRYMKNRAFIPEFLEIECPTANQVFAMAKALGFSKKDCKPWGGDRLLSHYGLRV